MEQNELMKIAVHIQTLRRINKFSDKINEGHSRPVYSFY